MKTAVSTLLLLLLSYNLYAPPNCEIYQDDAACYEACAEAMQAIRYRQGSFESQQHFNKSIDLCPTFDYSYMEKAVPYLKRGLFVEWKQLIDVAVALDPQQHLGYRGWCRLQFLRDYQGAIDDIETLKRMQDYDIGYCQTGDYHLNIALALCYKAIGQVARARALFDEELADASKPPGLYDYYHLGVLEYEQGNWALAIDHLETQIEINDYLAETYYYLALAHQQLGHPTSYRDYLDTAEQYYRAGKFRMDTYTETLDKIYLADILAEQRK